MWACIMLCDYETTRFLHVAARHSSTCTYAFKAEATRRLDLFSIQMTSARMYACVSHLQVQITCLHLPIESVRDIIRSTISPSSKRCICAAERPVTEGERVIEVYTRLRMRIKTIKHRQRHEHGEDTAGTSCWDVRVSRRRMRPHNDLQACVRHACLHL